MPATCPPDPAGLLARNLSALRSAPAGTGGAELAEAVEAAGPLAGAEKLATRDGGDWTLRISLPQGASVTLHSAYDPRREAAGLIAKQAGELDPRAAQSFVVLGFGLGYHLEALLAGVGSEAEIIVVENSAELVRAAAELRDLGALFSDPRLTWAVGRERQDLYMLLRLRQQTLIGAAALRLIAHLPSAALAPDYYQDVRNAIRDFAVSGEMTYSTQFSAARRTVANQMNNLALYAGAPSLTGLRPFYAGRPGIVVSAGPSLRKNLDQLRAARGKVVLVACDVVLKPLLERGIVPDFTAIVDYQGHTRKFFETLPPGVRTRLVATPAAAHGTVGFYPGPLAFAGDQLLDAFLGELRRDMGGRHGGGNVGHFCFLIACHLGLAPIAFVGQDLAYPLNITHLPGTPIHEDWQNERNRFYTLEMRELEGLLRKRPRLRLVPAQDGGEIFTEPNMYHYLRELEVAIKSVKDSGRRVVDCTEGGTLKAGAEIMKLAEFLAECPEREPPGPGADFAERDRGRLAAAAALLDRRLIEFLDVKAAIEQKQRTHRRIEKALAENEPPERYMRTAMEMGQRIDKHPEIRVMLQAAAPKGFYDATRTDRQLRAESAEGADKLQAQFRRDDLLLKALADGAEFLEPLLREARRRCQELAEKAEAAP